ncbi:uncharacterized protein KY384_008829 [Bacidia gigantensis]|uniref:uncharacterized protein n=1 Tax=Bacidia gigantensis TaxID=2732470 RepID=UPI001D040AA3|nr:uncharacterized protein KY384_008829 [Bacidia gigantensis]KAG8526628.1 hypothetical protein KY384_008829 [Bacidia gigantensis]
MDYGHQRYLDTLSSQKHIVLCAIERLERRLAEHLYEKQQWFKWVRSCQDTEEQQREHERKKVKAEAAMFKRHQRELDAHTQSLQAKEYAQKQETALDEAYQDRMSEMEKEAQEAEWDPIEDVMEDERQNFVDLIRHFLFLSKEDPALATNGSLLENIQTMHLNGEATPYPQPSEEPQPQPAGRNTSKKKKKKKKAAEPGSDVRPLDKSNHETLDEIKTRLKEGGKLAPVDGLQVAGTIGNPIELRGKIAPFADGEIEDILKDIPEIQTLLFCRLLLAHAAILPAAIKAGSVDEFLSDPEVSETDLRDLCLKMDKPNLQEVRDACADLTRGAEEGDEDSAVAETEYGSDEEARAKQSRREKAMGLRRNIKGREKWSSESEKQIQEGRERAISRMNKESMKADIGTEMIDFGDLDDTGKFRSRNIRVKICGKYIYNYPSEKAVSRGGWLHFCIIAKDSDLNDAIKLCRHWDEFWELNILSVYQYFPAANWSRWKGDIMRQQFLTLSGSRNQQFRRQHAVVEMRNFMCGHVNRDDPASRRFLQYLTLQTDSVLCLIRDAKSGKVLYKPPPSDSEDETDNRWLGRSKHGLGRATKNSWDIIEQVDANFFDRMDSVREWRFGFNDYYGVYVWDLVPAHDANHLYGTIVTHILKSITRDPQTKRIRDIRPDETIPSIWDESMEASFSFIDPNQPDGLAEDQHTSSFYQEADALEDQVLFPDDQKGAAAFKGNAVDRFLSNFPDWSRFVNDLSTDEEMCTDSDEEWEDEDHDNHLIDGPKQHLRVNDVEKSSSEESESISGSDDELVVTSIARNDPALRLFTKARDGNYTPLGDKFKSKALDKLSDEMRRDVLATKGWKSTHDYTDTRAEFMNFIDREKSKPMKLSWHRADLTPGADDRRREQARLVAAAKRYNLKKNPFKQFADLRFVNVHPERHRRMCADMVDARALITPFFPHKPNGPKTQPFTFTSQLLDQAARAQQTPAASRSTSSMKDRPKSFFSELDALDLPEQKAFTNVWDEFPRSWDNATRPILARLFKAGIISPCAANHVPGQVFSAHDPKTPNAPLDLFVDYRANADGSLIFPPSFKDPPPLTRC